MVIDSMLVVCTANICRSPFVEAMLQKRLPGKSVSSAGTEARPGDPADSNMLDFAASNGIDLSDHRSRPVTKDTLSEADLVLVMEWRHAEVVRLSWPQFSGKVMLLGKWNNEVEVSDPYRLSLPIYQQTVEQMLIQIDRWVEKLK